jgi:hypothetical protein
LGDIDDRIALALVIERCPTVTAEYPPIEDLREAYPCLSDQSFTLWGVRKQVVVPNTGNDQADYETVRSRVESLAKAAGEREREA